MCPRTLNFCDFAGALAPTPIGGAFSGFGSATPAINDAGAVLFWASVNGGTGTEGLFLSDGGGITTIAAVGQATPFGGTYADFPTVNGSIGNGPALKLNNTPEIAFAASIADGAAASGVFRWEAGATTGVFSSPPTGQGPSLNDAGWMVFDLFNGDSLAITVEHSGVFETALVIDDGEVFGVVARHQRPVADRMELRAP
jgi:hypothetical protein